MIAPLGARVAQPDETTRRASAWRKDRHQTRRFSDGEREVCHIPPRMSKPPCRRVMRIGGLRAKLGQLFPARLRAHRFTSCSLLHPCSGAACRGRYFRAVDATVCPRWNACSAAARASSSPCANDDRLACASASACRSRLDWPVAPHRFAGEGEDPGGAYWLRADPVHLRVHRDQLILLPPRHFRLTEAESASAGAMPSTAILRRTVSLFQAPHPQRWYLRTLRLPGSANRYLEQPIGRDVNRLLPAGEDRMRWHRIIQRSADAAPCHPVNEAREERGALPINSLWFWGGGTLPPASGASMAVASGDLPLIAGPRPVANVRVAAPVGRRFSPRPAVPWSMLRGTAGASARPNPAGRHGSRLDNAWFAPLLGEIAIR